MNQNKSNKTTHLNRLKRDLFSYLKCTMFISLMIKNFNHTIYDKNVTMYIFESNLFFKVYNRYILNILVFQARFFALNLT